jgi:cytochrome c5
LQQDKEILYEHALRGFHGENGTEMPPRGGNAALSDDEVRAAVDYMVALVSSLSGE